MTSGEGILLQRRGHLNHQVKLHDYFKYLLFYSRAQTRQLSIQK